MFGSIMNFLFKQKLDLNELITTMDAEHPKMI